MRHDAPNDPECADLYMYSYIHAHMRRARAPRTPHARARAQEHAAQTAFPAAPLGFKKLSALHSLSLSLHYLTVVYEEESKITSNCFLIRLGSKAEEHPQLTQSKDKETTTRQNQKTATRTSKVFK